MIIFMIKLIIICYIITLYFCMYVIFSWTKLCELS